MSLPRFCKRHGGRRLARLLALTAVALLLGCGSRPERAIEVPPSGKDPVAGSLLAHYRQWQGVPYRLGGEDRKGIDCSAFVRDAFRVRFGIALPRTTRAQRRHGHPVSGSEYQPGDLVFFRTGRKQLHVGIYLSGHRFLHASTSVGVTLSSLESHYWKPRLLEIRRLGALME